jgi:hypothetical protein
MLDALAKTKKGASAANATLVTFIKDMLSNMDRAAHGRRWSDTTKGLLVLLFTRGSPRAMYLFSKQLGLASVRTIQRFISKHRFPAELGFSPTMVKAVVKFYQDFMTRNKIPPGSIAFILSEDETAITGGATYSMRNGKIYGHCGKEGAGHKCDCVGVDVRFCQEEGGYGKLVAIMQEYRTGRCMRCCRHAKDSFDGVLCLVQISMQSL